MATAATRKGANRNAFLVIARDLQDRIADGEIELGRYLPTERELQDRYDVSRSTIRRAIAHLVDMGWAHTVPSKGVVA
ncbi:winged helix-turn-helix domain-containing protein, partial [Pseudomonas sp. GW456-12-1-14-LB2]|uniref:winged helix-turn-helix domain-containing protein n=1 Tax=Pseudomonas sp. GW456-12-1-14-LB2 TaxID=2070606 RepID=UPI000CBAF872